MDEEKQKKHDALGVYCVYILIISSSYNLLSEMIRYLDAYFISTVFITVIAMLFFLIFFVLMIHNTGYPLSLFGFTTKNWAKYSIEAIVFSIVFCALITLLKWYLITCVPLFDNLSLFKDYEEHFSTWDIWIPVIYVLFTPVQVFLAHGAVQSPLLEFLPMKNRAWLSVIVSTLLFSSAHVELNVIFAIAVLFPGLCWAVMYLRHKTLISITISHAIIGVWAFAVLELQDVFELIYSVILPLPD